MSKSKIIDEIASFMNQMKRSFHLRILLVVIISGLIPSLIISFGIVESYESRATSLQAEEVQTQMRI